MSIHNQAQWVASWNSQKMLELLTKGWKRWEQQGLSGGRCPVFTDRKARLYCTGLCRFVKSLLKEGSLLAVETCEEWADAPEGTEIIPSKLESVRRIAETARRNAVENAQGYRQDVMFEEVRIACAASGAHTCLFPHVFPAAEQTDFWIRQALGMQLQSRNTDTDACHLLRDLIGDPWQVNNRWSFCQECNGSGWTHRSVRGVYSWGLCTLCGPSETTINLAQTSILGICNGIHPEDVIGIIADSLEDQGLVGIQLARPATVYERRIAGAVQTIQIPAGQQPPKDWEFCGHLPHPLIEHLRHGGSHHRGCWAIDTILGQE